MQEGLTKNVQANKIPFTLQEQEKASTCVTEEQEFLRCRVEGVVQGFEEDPLRSQMWNGIAAQLGELTRAEVTILAHSHLDDHRFIRTMELWFGTRWTTNAKTDGADRKRKRSWMTDEDIHRWEAAVRAASAVNEDSHAEKKTDSFAVDLQKQSVNEGDMVTCYAPLSAT